MKFAAIGAVIALVVLFLAATINNGGCLPWQERVVYSTGGGDGIFRDETQRCDGSWFPFGSAIVDRVGSALPVLRALD